MLTDSLSSSPLHTIYPYTKKSTNKQKIVVVLYGSPYDIFAGAVQRDQKLSRVLKSPNCYLVVL